MPIMHVLLLLLTQTTPADKVLDRYVALHKQSAQMAVSYTASSARRWVKGQTLVDARSRLYIAMQGPGLDYVASITPKQVVELDKIERVYDEHPGEPHSFIPRSRLTGAVQYFPAWLFASDLRQILPKGVSFLIAPQESIGGANCDRVTAKYKIGEQGSGLIDASIDASGVVRRIRIFAQSQMGATDFEWRFTEMRPMRASDFGKFDLKLPLGYVPYALPDSGTPVAVDDTFPMTGWTSNSGALNLTTKLGAKGGLIAIIGQDSQPSEAAKASIRRISADVPVVTLNDGDHAVAGIDGFDRSGKLLGSVNPPATPFFALVDAKGKVRRLWMGFDSEKASEFEKDVRNSFSSKE